MMRGPQIATPEPPPPELLERLKDYRDIAINTTNMFTAKIDAMLAAGNFDLVDMTALSDIASANAEGWQKMADYLDFGKVIQRAQAADRKH
jgi:hypothetical protein